MVHLGGVSKTFGDRTVLDDLDLTVRRGENVAILGGSGTGKSVLLRLVAGLLEPDAGEISLWGESTEGLSEDGWLPLRRRMGVVFQSGALFDSMSVFENIAFPLRERGEKNESTIRDVVEERLEWVHLPGAGERLPSELSGGMRRRVALARTLAYSPEFVLYDEPTTGLDPLTAKKVAILMRELDDRLHSTSILVTHDLKSAQIVASRWTYLSGGKMLADGSPEELFRSPQAEVREFLGAYGWERDLQGSREGKE